MLIPYILLEILLLRLCTANNFNISGVSKIENEKIFKICAFDREFDIKFTF